MSEYEDKNDVSSEAQADDDSKPDRDYFWMKVLIVMIVVVWFSLLAGSWVGNYLLDSDIIPKNLNSEIMEESKPKVWKTIVEVDKSGAVSKSAVLADNTSDLKIDDFRNIDDPIPGIDDQSIKNFTPQDISPLQEPTHSNSSSPNLNGKSYERVNSVETPGQPEINKSPDDAASSHIPDEEEEGVNGVVAAPSEPSPSTSVSPSPDNAVSEPSPSPSPSEPSETGASGTYNIQMGVFSNKANAENLVEELKEKGHKNVVMEKVSSGGKEVYKIKLTETGTRDEVEHKSDYLKKDGFDSMVIAN